MRNKVLALLFIFFIPFMAYAQEATAPEILVNADKQKIFDWFANYFINKKYNIVSQNSYQITFEDTPLDIVSGIENQLSKDMGTDITFNYPHFGIKQRYIVTVLSDAKLEKVSIRHFSITFKDNANDNVDDDTAGSTNNLQDLLLMMKTTVEPTTTETQ